MTESYIENHPLEPFLPLNAKLLMLGSFPPPRHRWKMDFYYPNYQNDMWRIFGLVFFEDADHFIDTEQKQFLESKIKAFLTQKGIAIYDTAEQVNRLQGNAADKFLHIIKATDIAKLLSDIPHCKHIMTTGDKATETLMSVLPKESIAPTIQTEGTTTIANRVLDLHRLPSSSRAYPLALAKKAQLYAEFFKKIKML